MDDFSNSLRKDQRPKMPGYVYPIRREHPRRSPTAVVALRRLWCPKTTMVERFLLIATTSVLPLQSDLPKVRGISMGFIMFALVAGYMLLWRPRIFVRSLRHPVFLAGFTLIGISLVMEILHDSTGFFMIRRILLMLFGAVVLAAPAETGRRYARAYTDFLVVV